jgi:hypothetical protein
LVVKYLFARRYLKLYGKVTPELTNSGPIILNSDADIIDDIEATGSIEKQGNKPRQVEVLPIKQIKLSAVTNLSETNDVNPLHDSVPESVDSSQTSTAYHAKRISISTDVKFEKSPRPLSSLSTLTEQAKNERSQKDASMDFEPIQGVDSDSAYITGFNQEWVSIVNLMSTTSPAPKRAGFTTSQGKTFEQTNHTTVPFDGNDDTLPLSINDLRPHIYAFKSITALLALCVSRLTTISMIFLFVTWWSASSCYNQLNSMETLIR